MQNAALKEKRILSKNLKPFWEDLPHSKILNMRFCDFDLSIKNSFLEPLLTQVKDELSSRGIKIKPHFWLSDEWFTPDGIPGVALPFYLAHPRLTEVERQEIGFAEGDTSDWCLKILRHEIGHVIDNAFELRRRRMRQVLFGKSSIDYPDYYTYKPYSKRFVQHIEDGYAQAHPTEDFAETFAVWLDPTSNWRKRYKKWPAIKKLNYMENLMVELAGEEPKLKNKILIDPIQANKKTLGRHYAEKKAKWGIFEEDKFFDPGLLKIFSNSEEHKNYPSADSFFLAHTIEICREIAKLSGYPQYIIRQMLESVIERSKKLDLRVTQKEMTIKKHICYYLSDRIKIFISEGRHLISL